MSILDSPQFNRALFFPRADCSPTPPGARDVMVSCGPAAVHLRVHPVLEPARVLLFFHGNGEVVADYDAAAAQFARCGVTLAVADFRGYGQSTGEPTLRAALEDAHQVLAALRRHLPHAALWVMGRSLGGACAAELMRAQEGVRGFVLESAASDLAGVIRRRGILALPFSIEEHRVFDPIPKMAQCRKPVLILHGTQDTLIEPQEAQDSLGALPTGLGRLVLLPSVDHNTVSSHPGYWTALASFVGST